MVVSRWEKELSAETLKKNLSVIEDTGRLAGLAVGAGSTPSELENQALRRCDGRAISISWWRVPGTTV